MGESKFVFLVSALNAHCEVYLEMQIVNRRSKKGFTRTKDKRVLDKSKIN